MSNLPALTGKDIILIAFVVISVNKELDSGFRSE